MTSENDLENINHLRKLKGLGKLTMKDIRDIEKSQAELQEKLIKRDEQEKLERQKAWDANKAYEVNGEGEWKNIGTGRATDRCFYEDYEERRKRELSIDIIDDVEKHSPISCPICKQAMKMFRYPSRPIPSPGNRLYFCSQPECQQIFKVEGLNGGDGIYYIFDGDIDLGDDEDEE